MLISPVKINTKKIIIITNKNILINLIGVNTSI